MTHPSVSRLANPFDRTLRAYAKLRETYPDVRRALLVARGFARTSDHPLMWNQIADMLTAEQRVSR